MASGTERKAYRWLGLIAASLGGFLGALDLTVNVALPAIRAAFDIDLATVQWIIIAYVGTSTGLQLVVGRLADQFGLRRFYLFGVITYTAAVLLVAIAPTFALVLACRVLQAFGYALIVTTVPAIVTQLFPPTERGRALGAMTSVQTLGMIAATLGGGYLIDAFGWASIFATRVPFGLAALALAWWVLREPETNADGRLAPVSVVTLIITVAGLVLALNLGGRIGWGEPLVLAFASMTVVGGFFFLRSEKRAPVRIVDPSVLTPNLMRALSAGFLMSMATFINLFILPFFVSDVLGEGAMVLGLLLTIPPVASAVSAPLAGWLADRTSAPLVATGAITIVAIGTFSFTLLDTDATALHVGYCLALFGLGMGSFQSSNASSVLGGLTAKQLGVGSALLSLAFSLGMITSIGLMTALFENFRDAARVAMPNASEIVVFTEAFRSTYYVAAGLLVVGIIILLTRQRDRDRVPMSRMP